MVVGEIQALDCFCPKLSLSARLMYLALNAQMLAIPRELITMVEQDAGVSAAQESRRQRDRPAAVLALDPLSPRSINSN